jgi:hypothetical protein
MFTPLRWQCLVGTPTPSAYPALFEERCTIELR